MQDKLRALGALFLSFARVGVLTFGGGSSARS